VNNHRRFDTKFPVYFSFFLDVQLQFSQLALYRLAWNFAQQFGLISDRFSPIFGGIAPGTAEPWASTGAK